MPYFQLFVAVRMGGGGQQSDIPTRSTTCFKGTVIYGSYKESTHVCKRVGENCVNSQDQF